MPAGLGARDTLRLEVCFHLYGNDLSTDRDPIEAGLGWCCKLDTGFIGSDALARSSREQALVPFAFTGPGIPRQGNPVSTAAGRRQWSPAAPCRPCLGTGIGMAYVPLRGGRAGHRDRGRRPRQAARGRGARQAPVRQGELTSGRELPRGPEVPPRARLGADRGRGGHLRHHLVRPGRAGRGRVLRPARGRRVRDQGPGLHRGRVREGGLATCSRRSRARSWP